MAGLVGRGGEALQSTANQTGFLRYGLACSKHEWALSDEAMKHWHGARSSPSVSAGQQKMKVVPDNKKMLMDL